MAFHPVTWAFRVAISDQVCKMLRGRYPLIQSLEERTEQCKLETMYMILEDECFAAAASQSDYLEKLYMKLSTVESLSQICSILPSNSGRNFGTHGGSSITTEMGGDLISAPLNTVPSTGSVNDSFNQVNGTGTFDMKSTATSSMKMSISEANHVLLEEIREINQHLIRTRVEITDDFIDTNLMRDGLKRSEATFVKCLFKSVAHSLLLHATEHSPPVSLWLFVPPDYPSASPIPMFFFPAEYCKDCKDLCYEIWSRCRILLRELPVPLSLADIARTWEASELPSAIDVITDDSSEIA